MVTAAYRTRNKGQVKHVLFDFGYMPLLSMCCSKTDCTTSNQKSTRDRNPPSVLEASIGGNNSNKTEKRGQRGFLMHDGATREKSQKDETKIIHRNDGI